jgi:type IV secretory pathway VirB10-like protein
VNAAGIPHDVELDERNLEIPSEPLQKARHANPLPFRLEFLVLAVLAATVVFVIYAVNMGRNAAPRSPLVSVTAPPPILPGGDPTLGQDIVDATPRPRPSAGQGAPIGSGETAPTGGSVAGGPARAKGDADLEAALHGAANGATDQVSVPPTTTSTIPPATAPPAAPQPPPVYVPAPQAAPQVTLGAAQPQPQGQTSTTDDGSQGNSGGGAPSAIVSGGVTPRGPQAAPPSQQMQGTGGMTTVNPNDAVVARRLAFNSSSSAAPGYLSSRVHDPISQYEIFAGTPVLCQLDDNINTSLPGDWFGHVIRDVHASRPPYPVVIPAGTRLQGRYNGSVLPGDKQIQLAADTMKFSDGRVFDLLGMPGADTSGEAGLAASGVDDHRGRIFTTTLLTAVLQAGLAATQPVGSLLSGVSVGQQVAGAVGSSIAQTGQQLVSQQVQRPPTLTVERGQQFMIRLRSTIVIAPQEGDQQ